MPSEPERRGRDCSLPPILEREAIAPEFIGREVTCYAVRSLIKVFQERGASMGALLEGVSYPKEHLQDRNQRISWESFCRLLNNATAIWSDEQIEQVGVDLLHSRMIRPVVAMARILFSPAQFYHWFFEDRKWMQAHNSGVISASFMDQPEGRLAIEMNVHPNYEATHALFLIQKGVFAEMPRVLGLVPATVRMDWGPGGARFEIQLPAEGRWAGRLRRALSWPWAAKSAAEQLKCAHEKLRENYRRLEARSFEQDETRRALACSEERWRALIDSAPDVIFTTDREGTLDFINWMLVDDVPNDSIVGWSMYGFVTDESAGALREVFEEVIRSGEATTCEVEFARIALFESLAATWFSIRLGPLRRDGRIVGAIAICRDLTETRRADAERGALEARIRQKQKLEGLGVMASGIAHDFNNLLVGIQGNAVLLQEELAPNSPAQDLAGEIGVAGTRAADLIRGLLAYAGEANMSIDRIDLGELVREMIQLLGSSLAEPVALELDVPTPSPAINGDATQIRQVVMNLIINANDALDGRPGQVRASLVSVQLDTDMDTKGFNGPLEPGPYVCLCVEDDGCGMNEETLRQIFDPFFTTKFKGRGLGLAAVVGIVRAHRGAIEVTTEPGHGTRFRVMLPSTDAVGEKTKPERAAPTWRGEGTVLVVDDEPGVRRVISRVLQRQGFAVREACNGMTALDALSETPHPIAAVLDLTMPDTDGWELLREIREHDGELAVLLCSGHAEASIRERLDAEPGTAFVQKPFRPSELIDQLREVLSHPSR